MLEYKLVKRKVEDLKPDPNQPRKTFKQEDIKLLAQTYQSQGIINPIEIDAENVIITGEIRWRASKEAKLEEIECKQFENITKKEKGERQIIENEHNSKLTSEERENAIYHLWKIGNYKNQQELGDLLGISGSHIRNMIKSKGTRDSLKKENPKSKITSNIPSGTMIQISNLSKTDQVKVIKKAEKEKIPNFELRKLVTEIKKLPKEVKEEVLKPQSEITLEEAKEVAEFPEIDQRKQVMEQIKRTKKVAVKIIKEQKQIATGEKTPIIIVEPDQEKIKKMHDVYFQINQEFSFVDIMEYNGLTQTKCIEIMRKAYKFIFKEVEKYG